MLGTDPLSNRTVSAYPISIATSLALESIFETATPSFDPERQIPQKVNIEDYDELWINLSTLFRNILGSLTKEDSDRVGSKGLKETLIYEMETISSIVVNEGRSKARLIFYVCDYRDARSRSKYPYALFRMDSTDKQKIYRSLHNETISKLLENYKEDKSVKVLNSTLKPDVKCRALVLTHVAYDLLSYKNFTNLDLIESHTGVLKHRHSWYTKYHNGKDLIMFPFTEGLLQILGDNEIFKPLDIRIRRTLLEIAKEYNWTQLTTRDKILASIESMRDHFSREYLKKII